MWYNLIAKIEALHHQKLQMVEWITLNIASVAYTLAQFVHKEMWSVETIVATGVGISIIFLNIARGVAALRRRRERKEES